MGGQPGQHRHFERHRRAAPEPAHPYPKSAQWTKGCTIGPKSIKLETAAKSKVDMSRSGQDGLQGRFVPTMAVAGSGAGMSGMQVHLTRVR